MVDAVLLEWEGVLADTRPMRRDALRRALAAEGIAHTLSDDDRQLRGIGVTASVHCVMRHMGASDPVLADLLVDRATRAFAEMLAGGISLTPDAAAFVARLQSRARLALVTRASRGETETFLHLAGLEDAFSTVVTADEIESVSPCGAAFGRALDHLVRVRPVDSRNAVAVVDAAPSIRAARSAGVRVLAVGAPAHEAMDADAAVDSLEGLSMDEWIALVGGPDGRRHA